MSAVTHRGAIVSSGILLGTGLGGFVDGIVLHQILQWHNMLSSVRPPTDLVAMKYNMVWDGLFHAFTWITTTLGVARLWRAGQRTDVPWSTRTFVGAGFLGWGLFNAIEGLVDHQVLGIHHVHPGEGQIAWDLAFLASGLLMIAAGGATVHAGRRDSTPRGGSPGARTEVGSAMRTVPAVLGVLLVVTLAACGSPPAAAEGEQVESALQEGCACNAEKMSFTQSNGCQNDGSVEFCIPATDAELRGRLDRLGVDLTYSTSAGRARCDREKELLVMFPTPREDRSVCTVSGGLRRGTWSQLCAISLEPAVKKIVPTFYE